MKKLTCIVCPNSCALQIDEQTLEVTGGRCPRGAEFAKKEITRPMRSVTSTVRTAFADMPVVPVKTDTEIDKKMVGAVMDALKTVVVKKRQKIGTIILKNAANSGADIILTADME